MPGDVQKVRYPPILILIPCRHEAPLAQERPQLFRGPAVQFRFPAHDGRFPLPQFERDFPRSPRPFQTEMQGVRRFGERGGFRPGLFAVHPGPEEIEDVFRGFFGAQREREGQQQGRGKEEEQAFHTLLLRAPCVFSEGTSRKAKKVPRRATPPMQNMAAGSP